jgi:RNA polymerase sigma factor for flagellar operon FliA
VRRMSQTTRTTIMFKREHTAAIEKLTARYGRQPSSKEVASYLGKDLESYEKERVIVAGADSVATDVNDDTPLPDDWFEDSPESDLQKAELLNILADSVATLPERTQLVLSLYYAEELNLKEIASVIEVSESRVSQILSETAALLRRKVENRSQR